MCLDLVEIAIERVFDPCHRHRQGPLKCVSFLQDSMRTISSWKRCGFSSCGIVL